MTGCLSVCALEILLIIIIIIITDLSAFMSEDTVKNYRDLTSLVRDLAYYDDFSLKDNGGFKKTHL